MTSYERRVCTACTGTGRTRCAYCAGTGELVHRAGEPPHLPLEPSDHAHDVVRVTGTVWAHVQDALHRLPGLEGQLLGERARHLRELDRAARHTEDLWVARMIVAYALLATVVTAVVCAAVALF